MKDTPISLATILPLASDKNPGYLSAVDYLLPSVMDRKKKNRNNIASQTQTDNQAKQIKRQRQRDKQTET